ncbi:MAG TPA: hypothetical protein VNF68_06130 [Candidatus Baltobacteraceae bacterium]|nr:hypothetical protein [Candidatus Baltobacteraceae bacterium]
MHSDLLERGRIAREAIDVPAFPLASIRAAVAHPVPAAPRRRSLVAAIAASVSIVAIAAAAEIVQQAHIILPASGGIVISSDAKSSSRWIHTNAEVRDAAARLDFPATIPVGLPVGTRPIRLTTAGSSLLAIDYNLPGAQRRSHHMLWIFLANPSSMAALHASSAGSRPLYRLRMNEDMQFFRAGAEQVIIVSNGLTLSEFAAIKRAMERAAQ